MKTITFGALCGLTLMLSAFPSMALANSFLKGQWDFNQGCSFGEENCQLDNGGADSAGDPLLQGQFFDIDSGRLIETGGSFCAFNGVDSEANYCQQPSSNRALFVPYDFQGEQAFAYMLSKISGYPAQAATFSFKIKFDLKAIQAMKDSEPFDEGEEHHCLYSNLEAIDEPDKTFSDVLCSRQSLLTLGKASPYLNVFLSPDGRVNTEIAVMDSDNNNPLRLSHALYDTNEDLSTSTASWKDEHHIAISYQPTVLDPGAPNPKKFFIQVAMFVDGVLVEDFMRKYETVPSNANSALDLVVGATYLGDELVDHAFAGLLDDLKFYDRALSSKEVACLAEGSQFCIKETPVVGAPGAGRSGVSIVEAKVVDTNNLSSICTDIKHFESDAVVEANCKTGDWAVRDETNQWYWIGEVKAEDQLPLQVGLSRLIISDRLENSVEKKVLNIDAFAACNDQGDESCEYVLNGADVIDDVTSGIVTIDAANLDANNQLKINRTVIETSQAANRTFTSSLRGAQGANASCEQFEGSQGVSIDEISWVQSTSTTTAGTLTLTAKNQPVKSFVIPRGKPGADKEGSVATCPAASSLRGINGSLIESVSYNSDTTESDFGQLSVVRTVFDRAQSPTTRAPEVFSNLYGPEGERGAAATPNQVTIESYFLAADQPIPRSGAEGGYTCQVFVSRNFAGSNSRRVLKKCTINN